MSGRPSGQALWGTTAAGDILTWDPAVCGMDRQDNGLYIQVCSMHI